MPSESNYIEVEGIPPEFSGRTQSHAAITIQVIRADGTKEPPQTIYSENHPDKPKEQ